MRILELNEDTKKDILSNLLKRSPNSYGEYEGRVNAIIENVKANGDEAVFSYTEQFDGYKLTSDNIVVTDEEIAAAYEEIDDELVEIIRKALVNIRDYHAKQKRNSWFDAKPDGTILGQKITPLSRVGVYVPGGYRYDELLRRRSGRRDPASACGDRIFLRLFQRCSDRFQVHPA